LAKNTKSAQHVEILDRLMTLEKTMEILGIKESHVYMLEKHGHIKSIDISISGNGGSRTKRFSLISINNFIKNRKIDPESYFA
jgi:hypothetical protein